MTDVIISTIGEPGSTAQDVHKALAASRRRRISVTISGMGGDGFEALAIFNALQRYAGKIDMHIEGIAAGAVAVVAMAGDTRTINADGWLGFGLPVAPAPLSTAEEMRSLAEHFDRLLASDIKIFSERTGRHPAEIERIIRDLGWLNADDAKSLGFVTAVATNPSPATALSRFEFTGMSKAAPFSPRPASLPPSMTNDVDAMADFFRSMVIVRDLDEGSRNAAQVLIGASPLAWAKATGQAPETSDATAWTDFLARRAAPADTAEEIIARHAPKGMM